MEKHEKCSHECQCDCHKEGVRMVHMMPCCLKCAICGKRIKIGHMEEHLLNCHYNFIVDESLMKLLNKDDKWHAAFVAARHTYLETHFIASGSTAPRIIKFLDDFVKMCDYVNFDQFTCRVYVGEAFDEEALILEINFKSESKNKKLEMLFDTDGIVLHIAMS